MNETEAIEAIHRSKNHECVLASVSPNLFAAIILQSSIYSSEEGSDGSNKDAKYFWSYSQAHMSDT
jgi:hypothetical protein